MLMEEGLQTGHSCMGRSLVSSLLLLSEDQRRATSCWNDSVRLEGSPRARERLALSATVSHSR